MVAQTNFSHRNINYVKEIHKMRHVHSRKKLMPILCVRKLVNKTDEGAYIRQIKLAKNHLKATN